MINHWLQEEQNGVEFPVPLEIAWQIAGYSRKNNAKRRLISPNSRLIENQDYKVDSDLSTQALLRSEQLLKSLLSGSSEDSTVLSGDGFKHFCLLAETQEGRLVRQHFIEAKGNENAIIATSLNDAEAKDKKQDFALEQIQEPINHWLQQEQDRVQFPVPFTNIDKDAYNNVETNFIEGEDFLREFLGKSLKTPQGGRLKRSLVLSCDGFKQLCLLARTEAGRQIHQYLIKGN